VPSAPWFQWRTSGFVLGAVSRGRLAEVSSPRQRATRTDASLSAAIASMSAVLLVPAGPATSIRARSPHGPPAPAQRNRRTIVVPMGVAPPVSTASRRQGPSWWRPTVTVTACAPIGGSTPSAKSWTAAAPGLSRGRGTRCGWLDLILDIGPPGAARSWSPPSPRIPGCGLWQAFGATARWHGHEPGVVAEVEIDVAVKRAVLG
jgi:hypothetical protein